MPSKKSLSFRLIIGLMLASLILSNFSLILVKKAQAQESEPAVISQPIPVDPVLQPVDNSNGEVLGLPIKEISKPEPQPIILDPVEEPSTPPITPVIEDPAVSEPDVLDPLGDTAPKPDLIQPELPLAGEDNGPVDMYGNRDNAGKQPKDKVGSYNVDELTGLFSYAYPLAIPKGRANLQPDISLQYNHRQVNIGSMVGFGWELNMPSVSRDNRTGVDNIYNEKYFTLNLGGSSQLQPISIDGSGYGTYGKLSESDFSKIEFSSDNKWIVTDKLGTVYTFGSSIDARQDNPNNPAQVYKWLLEEIRDTNDNFVRYEYYKDSGQIYPKKIFYTGSGMTDGIYEVDFQPFAGGSMTPNNITNSSLQTGFDVQTKYLLDRIEIKVNSQIKTVYDLVQGLNQNNNKYLLQSIIPEFYDNGIPASKDRADFQYTYQPTTYASTNQYSLPGGMSLGSTSQQGYGKQDYFLDLNSDSYADFIRVSCSSGQVNVDAWMNNGQGGWATNTAFDLNASFTGYCGAYYGGSYYSMPLTFANLNGDHFVDMAMDNRSYINTGSSWQQASSSLPVSLTQMSSAGSPPMNSVIFQDMNGDGYDDIIYDSHTSIDSIVDVYIRNVATGGWTLNSGYHTSVTMGSSDCLIYGGDPYGFTDFNSDGLEDIFYKYHCLYGEHHEEGEGLFLNTGSGFALTTAYLAPAIMSDFSDVARPEQTVNYFSDFDGDGSTDYGKYHKELNNGNSSGNLQLMAVSAFDTGVLADAGAYYRLSLPVAIADFNGDQVQDVLHSRPGASDTYLGNGQKSDILKEVDYESGTKINISYGFSAQEKKADGSLANPELPYNMYVANEVVVNDGLNNWTGYQYKYSDGKTYDNANEKLKDIYGFAKVELKIGKAMPDVDMGTGVDGDFVSHGDATWTTDKNFNSLYIQTGDTITVEPNVTIKVRGDIVINGVLSAFNQGYQGGTHGSDGQGFGKGGGGGYRFDGVTYGGGGAGHATDGQDCANYNRSYGWHGNAYGQPDLSDIESGSGGGAGGDVSSMAIGGYGGNGGGIIRLYAYNLDVNGEISADGHDGLNGQIYTNQYAGGGGGGAGGSIYIRVLNTADIGDNLVHALGGIGGQAGGYDDNGGNGANGLIRIEAKNIVGSSYPTYYSTHEFKYSIDYAVNDTGLQKQVNTYQLAKDDGLYLHGKLKSSSTYDRQDNLLAKQNSQWQTQTLGNDREFAYKTQDTNTQVHLLEAGPLREQVVDANTLALYHMNGAVSSADKKDNAQGNSAYDLTEEDMGSGNIDSGFNNQANGAYRAAGGQQRVVSNLSGLGDGAFTLEMWIKHNGSTLSMRPFGKTDSNDHGFAAEYDYNQNYIWFYSTSDKYSWTVHSAPNSVHLGQWQYFAFVMDTQNAYIYIDGELSGQGAVTYNNQGVVNEKLYLFCNKPNCNNAGPFSIDEVRLSDVPRGAQDIYDYYHNTQEPYYEVSQAKQYSYDLNNGNLLTEHDLGKVVANINTGNISDTLPGDEKDTNYEYAQNTTKHILAAPKNKEIASATESKDQDLYYDGLALGQVEKVNLTKEDYKVDAVKVERTFNTYGLVATEIDPKNATTTISYDNYNLYPASATNALDQVTLTEYNLFNGQVASSTDPNGLRIVNTYDAFGRLILTQISDPTNPTALVTKQEISYQDTTLPRYKETKDYYSASLYKTSREYYDGLGRTVQKKAQTENSGEYATVDISYDAQGRVGRESLPYMTSSLAYSTADLSKPAKTYTYDAQDRILTETNPTGSTSYEYDGFTTKITDANGILKELTKDAYGNLVQVKEHNGSNVYTTNYEYTLTNKLKKITDSAGNIRNFSYDALDNLEWQDMVHKTSVTNPAKIQYTYDKNGNVLTETSFKADNISYTYDNLNRALAEKLDGANKITYTYDNGQFNKGKLVFANYGSNNSKAYDYNILGQVTTATTTISNEPFVLKYEYNLDGSLSKVIYPNNSQVTYGFNNIGQVNSVSLIQTSTSQTIADNIQYNQNGQMVHLERANGVVTDYTYDPAQAFRLTRILTVKSGQTLQDLNYTYDPVGNILTLVDNANTDLQKSATYTYDDLNRLLSATVSYTNHPDKNYVQIFTYDSIGNMTSNSDLGTMNYANGQPHQLSSYGTRNFQYDTAGNMTRNGGITKFAWDWRNRLDSTYDIASENNTYYKYDHNNQRFLKYTEDYVFIPYDPGEDGLMDGGGGRSMSSSATIGDEAVLDGGGLGGHWEWQTVSMDKYVDKYYEKNLNNQTKSHIFLNGIKLATVNNSDQPYYILGDHLGSSSILTNSTGTTAQLTDYQPYGKINYDNRFIDLKNDYKFTGKEADEETSLQYFGARYMDNQTARFTSIDPAILILHDGQKLKEITNGELVLLLSNPQNLNSYAYAVNNPVIMEDESGEFAGPFGRDMASGQRQIAAFLHNAANYTSNQGGAINKVAGFVTNTIADTFDNVANVYDPDQKVGTRFIALGLVALDASSGGEGKAAGKSVKLLDSTFAKAAEHAVEQGHFSGKTADEIAVIAKDTYKNYDIKATIKNAKKYYYNIKDNILFIDNPKQPTIFQPDRGYDYVKENILKDLSKH